MTVLLHISDLHFGTEQEHVVDALLALVAQVEPALVVVSGDISQRARRRQFDAAHRFMQRLGATPSLVIPGNHDIPLYNVVGRALRPYAGYRRVFGDNLEPVFESESLLVIGLNTTRARRHKDGEVSATQIERVAAMLERAPDRQLRVIVTHQPLVAFHAGESRNLLHGREGALLRWLDAGVDITLGGHLHWPYAVPLDAARPSSWAVQAGTSLSSRVRHGAPNSANVIRWKPRPLLASEETNVRRVILERWDYDDHTASFQCIDERSLPLKPF